MGIRKKLRHLRRSPTEMDANGDVKARGLFIDRKELRIG
jgi:hypothetical protein